MPAITTNDLKNGITLELDNGLFQVVEFQHVKPGKGGAFVRTKLRNVKTGNVFDRTFNAGDTRRAGDRSTSRTCSSSTATATTTCSWTPTTYDQLHVAAGRPRRRRRLPGRAVDRAASRSTRARSCRSRSRRRSSSTITETEPGIQGDRVSGARKPATLETGQGGAGAAVRQHGRPGQGRHPHRRLHHPGLRCPLDDGLGPSRTSAPTARERALILLYEAESKGIAPTDVLDAQVLGSRRSHAPFSFEVWRPTGPQLDAADRRTRRGLDAGADAGDRPQRAADRRIRAARRPDVPVAVVIDEAVELAKRFSTDDSGRFVNGVLSALVPVLRPNA